MDLSNQSNWTWGYEVELADWDTRKGWEGYGRDPEPLIVNSSGVACDPTLKDYPFGGEINLPPTSTYQEQIDLTTRFKKLHPNAKVTYRGALHIHIRIPGLKDHLEGLKKIQKAVSESRDVFKQIYKQDHQYTRDDFYSESDYKLWRSWSTVGKNGGTFVLPEYRVQEQLDAKTVEEFMEAEVPKSKTGAILWHAQRRTTVNLRQLKQTDTVEFRHGHATFDETKLENHSRWCRDVLLCAFDGGNLWELFNNKYKNLSLCTNGDPFHAWMERRWVATNFKKNKREDIRNTITSIMDGVFDHGPSVPEELVWRP